MYTDIAPTMSASFSVIAERFRRAGQLDRAVALCREGLAAYPDHLSARVTLGCALLDLGQHHEAYRELQAVLQRAPDNLAAIRGLAELHARGVEEQDAQEMQGAHDFQIGQDAQACQAAPAVVAEPEIVVPENVAEPGLGVQASRFEIEDVIADADDVFDLPNEVVSLEFDLGADAVLGDLDPAVPAPTAAPDAIPVPTLSEGPIAVLDEWLSRARARQAELLSQYAAS